jgi:hypothetical protein
MQGGRTVVHALSTFATSGGDDVGDLLCGYWLEKLLIWRVGSPLVRCGILHTGDFSWSFSVEEGVGDGAHGAGRMVIETGHPQLAQCSCFLMYVGPGGAVSAVSCAGMHVTVSCVDMHPSLRLVSCLMPADIHCQRPCTGHMHVTVLCGDMHPCLGLVSCFVLADILCQQPHGTYCMHVIMHVVGTGRS